MQCQVVNICWLRPKMIGCLVPVSFSMELYWLWAIYIRPPNKNDWRMKIIGKSQTRSSTSGRDSNVNKTQWHRTNCQGIEWKRDDRTKSRKHIGAGGGGGSCYHLLLLSGLSTEAVSCASVHTYVLSISLHFDALGTFVLWCALFINVYVYVVAECLF